ncbi:DNA translocase FtsK [Odoribacter sp. OttesenSCG-928-A06]|nr:DNA translocase FtsK [Odoribacter sp. OttesenSCG-928-A06]
MKKKTKQKPFLKDEISSSFSFLKEPRTRFIIGLAFILFAAYLTFSMVCFFFTGGVDQSIVDQGLRKIVTNPDVIADNTAGKFGAWLSDLVINRWFGIASFGFCYILILSGIRISGKSIYHFKKKIFLATASILWVSIFTAYLSEIICTLLDIPGTYLYIGGAHGYFVHLWLNSIIGKIGTFFVLLLFFAIILFFGFEKTFNKCIAILKGLFSGNKKVEKEPEETPEEEEEEEEEEEQGVTEEIIPKEYSFEDILNGGLPEEPEDEPEEGDSSIDFNANNPFDEIPDFEEPEELLSYHSESKEDKEITDDDIELTVNDKLTEETVKKNMQPEGDYDPTLDLSNYQYPPLNLLEEHSTGKPKVTQEELEENKNKIVDTLRNYKIEIVKIKATIGPTVTLYEIVPAPGVKISKIKNLEDDIALSLSALGIRIIAPIPGAGTIGIEVPNQNPEIVSMHGIIASKKFQESKFALPVALGRTISNETYTFDLTKMPHLLVAGATGQGKSVGLNAIITSLLYKKHPSQLKFVMIDPKKVELSIYSVIEKHFLAKLPDEEEAIITETGKVINTLNSLCVEMDSRYDLLKDAQVRNIKEYNEKFTKRRLNPEKGHKYLPYIVVVVDEFADLIMTAGKEVEQPIARIAQLARAVGIHMIIATQRPSTNIITGVIKANFPARIAFKVASMIDSRTILDSPGANQLIGRGDLLISVSNEMIRVQCAFVDTPEVDQITHFIASQQGYPSAFALPEYHAENEGGGGLADADLGSKDPLFEEAARLVVNSQQGSTSSIQRRFSIGYNRAGRIVDQLEAAGVVGPFEGSKARQVLIPDEYSLEGLLRSLDERF